jgi:threonine dehydrogenase-like Zn-dependent dehydrogenase
VRLMEAGHVALAPLISHVFPLERAPEAFDLLLHKPEDALKIAIVP